MKTVQDILQVLWGSIKDLWEELLTLLLMNLATMAPIILTITLLYVAAIFWEAGQPTPGTAFMVLGIFPLILLPPAMAGLWSAAHRVTEGLAVGWADYAAGFRQYFWKSLGLALINALGLVILISNIWFYAPTNNPFGLDPGISTAIQVFFIILTVLWLTYHLYPLALLLEQSDQRLRTAFRNAGILFITRPGFTILLALALGIVLTISSYPLMIPWLTLTMSFIAIICNRAVKCLLVPHREQAMQKTAHEESAENQDVTEEG